MKLSELKTMVRARIPAAVISSVDNTTLELVLNEATLAVARDTECLKKEDSFDSTAESGIYVLPSIISDFLGVTKEGIWFYNGAQYKELFPKTLQWMNKYLSSWRTQESAELPVYYWIRRGVMSVHPKPSGSVTDAFLIYYFARPTQMSHADHYPFHVGSTQTQEDSELSILSETIVLKAKHLVYEMSGNEAEAQKQLGYYLIDVEKKKAQLEMRPDIANHRYTKKRGPRIGC